MRILIVVVVTVLSFNWNLRANQRDVAVLWDNSELDSASYTQSLVHRKLEVLLNHYGFKATYFDVHDKNFSIKSVDPKEFYALITWFSDDETNNVRSIRSLYRDWFKSKKKVISLGQMGIYYDNNEKNYNLNDINETLKLVNLEFEDIQYESPLGLNTIIFGDPKNVEFERDFKFEVPAVKVFKSLSPKNNILVNIKDTINGRESPAILYNESFFMVYAGLDIFNNPLKGFTQWRVNPFFIMKWLLKEPLAPIPDTTTINGKRLLYSQVDGDAFINISDIDRTSTSGEVLLNEVLEKYRIPTTVSFIAAEMDLKYLGKTNYINVAKKMASKSYVELASHTYFHPLSWEKNPPKFEIDAYLDNPSLYKGGPILAYQPKDKELNFEREIKGSLDFINDQIAPKDKQTNFILWSGSCVPSKEAMSVVKKYNYKNMNGGDSRFDKKFPSYSHLMPLYRSVDGMIQYYSSNTNEILYTNNWTGPFSGFSDVIETFENTEFPVRIKPINIYYHFYSAEKRSSLNALLAVYDWTKKQEYFPIFSSTYPDIIDGFIGAKISTINDGYSIKNAGKLKTFRVDSKDHYPDYQRSGNIIGHRIVNDSLYLFLGSKDETILTLSTEKQNQLHMVWSDFDFDQAFLKKERIILKGKSLKNRKMKFFVGKNRKFKNSDQISSITYEDEFAILEFKSADIDLTLELMQ